MILVIGGYGAGKTDFVYTLGYRAGEISDSALSPLPVIKNIQNIVAAMPGETDALFEALRGKDVLVCNEIGCGIVPIDNDERRVREETGRLCIRLAQTATAVIRVQCGIPVVIKGAL
ncbi:MAG: bifunctional adenosylcobinamide kinase/adenosylcobinamide-phosphate guanylyltransferase [Oscillospiraceae bacterium]|nr:bifunctional adenosylcobinamide kinase/adenosylcobinamide-phosphate guanylyltransferase [Oscillospiraceae bacterium]